MSDSNHNEGGTRARFLKSHNRDPEGGNDSNPESTNGGSTEMLMVERRQGRQENLSKMNNLLDQIGGMFQKVNTMVASQEEMLGRIDLDAEESEKNVKKGKRTVMEIFQDVSSNRKLIFQVFTLIIIMSVVYIIFFS